VPNINIHPEVAVAGAWLVERDSLPNLSEALATGLAAKFQKFPIFGHFGRTSAD
jgi:hypothetical protein